MALLQKGLTYRLVMLGHQALAVMCLVLPLLLLYQAEVLLLWSVLTRWSNCTQLLRDRQAVVAAVTTSGSDSENDLAHTEIPARLAVASGTSQRQ